jgi:hypothetical protein
MSRGLVILSKQRMRELVVCLGLGGAAVLAPGAAHAQWYGHRAPIFTPHQLAPIDDELSPRELVQAAREQGFNRLSLPVYRDDYAILNAVAPNGQAVRITLDVYSGQIVNLSPLARRQVAKVRPERHQEVLAKKRPQTVERAPDIRPSTLPPTLPPARRPNEVEKGGGATPEKPTIVRRAPLLPPQPGNPPVAGKPRQAPEKPVTSQAPANPGSVGTGTRDVPRKIELAPPAISDAPTPPI